MSKPIRASEIREFTYCPESWRLKRSGVKPSGAATAGRMAKGTKFHEAHARAVSRSGSSRQLGVMCLALALIGLLLWMKGGLPWGF